MEVVYTTLARWSYTALFYLAMPLLLLNLLNRSRRQPAYRQRLAERFGWCTRAQTPTPVWLHAVSVGEVEAAGQVGEGLLLLPHGARDGGRHLIHPACLPSADS